MAKLSPDELKSRLMLDYRVCQRMFGGVFTGEAYRTTSDLEQRRNPITSVQDAGLAVKYRIDFQVKTLIGRGPTADHTIFGFDLEVGNYPYNEPYAWLISSHVPYSPHFKASWPICTGNGWEQANGHMLLGELLVHIAKLLNWDEKNIVNEEWQRDAIKYHRKVYKGRPITPGLRYPVVPVDLLYGSNAAPPPPPPPRHFLFRPTSHPGTAKNLFRGKGLE